MTDVSFRPRPSSRAGSAAVGGYGLEFRPIPAFTKPAGSWEAERARRLPCAGETPGPAAGIAPGKRRGARPRAPAGGRHIV